MGVNHTHVVIVDRLKDRVRKVRDIEQKVWTDELAEIHRVVDEELQAIRQMAAGLYPTSDPTSVPASPPPSHLCNGLDSEHWEPGDAESDDGGFDVDSMKLKLCVDEDPPVPELYLSQSPATDGGQSLSW